MAAVDAWIRGERTWPLRVNPSQVRRNLFGTVDHEYNRQFLEDEIEKQYNEDNQKWDFDFKNEVPITDTRKTNIKYLWTPVRRTDCGDAAPRMPEMENSTASEEEPRKGKDTEVSSLQKSDESPLRQTHITDYMRKRKAKNGITSSTEPSIKKKARRSSA